LQLPAHLGKKNKDMICKDVRFQDRFNVDRPQEEGGGAIDSTFPRKK
jgi:hypothetical protein